MGLIKFINDKKEVLVGGAVGLSAICYDLNDNVFAELTTPKGLENTVLVQETEGSSTPKVVGENKDGASSSKLAAVTKTTTTAATPTTTGSTPRTAVSTKKTELSTTKTTAAKKTTDRDNLTETESRLIDLIVENQEALNLRETSVNRFNQVVRVIKRGDRVFLERYHEQYMQVYGIKEGSLGENIYLTDSETVLSMIASLERKGKLTDTLKTRMHTKLAENFCKLLVFKEEAEQIGGGLNEDVSRRYNQLIASVVTRLEDLLEVDSREVDEATKTASNSR